MKTNWKQKLSSRKFWTAVAAFAGTICVLLGVDELTAEKLIAVITSLGVLAAYILTEGYLDGKAMETEKSEEPASKDN